MRKIDTVKQHFQPLRRDVRNWWDYRKYVATHSSFDAAGRTIIKIILFLIGLVTFFMDGIPDVHSPVLLILTGVTWILSGALTIWDWAGSLDNKSLYTEAVPDVYRDVKPPEEILEWQGFSAPWKRKVLRIMRDGRLLEESTIYTNEAIDRWLYDGADQVKMRQDKEYERDLKNKIRWNFQSTYQPFLYQNYRTSRFFGRQFTNEEKWGISEEFRPGAEVVAVHRSCYFDTYLTNISPGTRLCSTRLEEPVISLDQPRYLPYTLEDGNVKRLRPLGVSVATANELGVTTLCLLRDERYIPLWRQNHQAQSSRAQLVATGSGSADWDDCEQYLKAESRSFPKAIIRGMERELYEESIGKRAVLQEDYLIHTKTEITGYFRWLKKGAKSEFVGISRTDMKRLLDKMSPEESEVVEGARIPARNICTLKKRLYELVHPLFPEKETAQKAPENEPQPETPKNEPEPKAPENEPRPEAPECKAAAGAEEDEVYVSEECSISCAAAILALQALCERRVCESCAHRDRCCPEVCTADPCEVLFRS